MRHGWLGYKHGAFIRVEVDGEGVETEEQLDVLRQLACDEVQGYLISRAAPPDEITAFLVKQSDQKKSA